MNEWGRERNETNENERNGKSADERNERTTDDVERVSSERVSVYTHARSHTRRHELCYVLWGLAALPGSRYEYMHVI